MTDKCARTAQWLTDKYLILMLFIFPLFTGVQGYGDITRSKYLFFLITTSVWLLCLLLLAVRGRLFRRCSVPQLLVLAFAVWACISAAVSPNRRASLVGASRYDGLLTLLLYAGIFLGVSSFGKRRRKYVWLLCVAAVGCIGVGLAQIAGSSVLFPNEYTYYDAGILYVSKFLGTIGNTNLLAAFLCLVIPLCAAASALGWRGGPLLRLTAMFGACLLSFTDSSGGILALAAAAAFCAPLLADRGVLPECLISCVFVLAGLAAGCVLLGAYAQAAMWLALASAAAGMLMVCRRFIPPEKHRRAVLTVLCAVLVLGLLTVYCWPGERGTVYELSQLLHGRPRDEFGSSRLLIWRETLRLVPERLLFGGGPDTLALRLKLDFSRYFPALGQTLTTYADNAHNVYLGYLVNLGLPGLTIYLALMAMTLRRILKHREAWTLILGSALLCAWAENFFGLGLCLVSPIMWVLWALVFAGGDTQEITGVEHDEEADKTTDHLYAAGRDGDRLSDAEQAPERTQQHRPDARTHGGDGFPQSDGHAPAHAAGSDS